jgi:transposase
MQNAQAEYKFPERRSVMNGFHAGGSEAYLQGLQQDYAEKIRKLDDQMESCDQSEHEILERRKSELNQELKAKLADAGRMLH